MNKKILLKVIIILFAITVGVILYRHFYWATYTNQIAGFSIDFPNNYKHQTIAFPLYEIREEWYTKVAESGHLSGDVVTIIICLPETKYCPPSSFSDLTQAKDIDLGGIQTRIIASSSGYLQIGPLNHNGKSYQIFSNNNSPFFYQILSSFKFK